MGEARTLLEQADRNRRMVEHELADINETLSDLTCQNQAISGAKMKCEQEMNNMGHDLDEMAAEAAMSEEKAQRAMVDAARLADELRAEQDHAMAKMETRIHELESEMDAENRRCQDAHKNLRKSERAVKELTYQHDEDKKNHERMQSLIDQLQSKIKSYKKQIEEAEEIAALNLAKYRTVQANLSGINEAADHAEQELAKSTARAKSSSVAK